MQKNLFRPAKSPSSLRSHERPMSENLEIDFCLETLSRALNKNIPEIFNMDQGSQFTSQQFTEILENKKIPRGLKIPRTILYSCLCPHGSLNT